MGTKYLRNTDDATIVCRIASDMKRRFIFKPKKVDKSTGTIISNGFTEISEADLKLLEEESKAYQYYSRKGRLTVAESLPQESMTQEQLVIALRTENSDLKKELTKLKKAKPDGEAAKALQTAMSEIEELKNTIETLSAELQAATKDVDGKKSDGAEETGAEKETKKKKKNSENTPDSTPEDEETK